MLQDLWATLYILYIYFPLIRREQHLPEDRTPGPQDGLHGTDRLLVSSDQEGDITELWQIGQEAEIRTQTTEVL